MVDEAWLRNVAAVAQSSGRLAYRMMTEGVSAAEMQEVITMSTKMSELVTEELHLMRGVQGTYSALPRLARYVGDTIKLSVSTITMLKIQLLSPTYVSVNGSEVYNRDLHDSRRKWGSRHTYGSVNRSS